MHTDLIHGSYTCINDSQDYALVPALTWYTIPTMPTFIECISGICSKVPVCSSNAWALFYSNASRAEHANKTFILCSECKRFITNYNYNSLGSYHPLRAFSQVSYSPCALVIVPRAQSIPFEARFRPGPNSSLDTR